MDPISRSVAMGAAGSGGKTVPFTAQIQNVSSGVTYNNFGVYTYSVYDNKNSFIVATTGYPGTSVNEYRVSIFKFNASTGALTWQRLLTSGVGFGAEVQGMTVDSQQNIYLLIRKKSGSSLVAITIIKYSPDGNILLQRDILRGGGIDPGALALDSSGGILVSEILENGIIYLDSSGSISSQSRQNGTNKSAMRSLFFDSISGYFYAAGRENISATGGYPGVSLAKITSGGTVLWDKVYWGGQNGFSVNSEKNAISVDSSGNPYVGMLDSSGFTRYYIIKYDSSGTFAWASTNAPGGTTNSPTYVGLVKDGNGNVINFGSHANNVGYLLAIHSVSSASTVQWQRNLGPEIGVGNATGISTDQKNHYFVAARSYTSGTSNNVLCFCFPTDGTKTNTYYSSIPYAASSSTIYNDSNRVYSGTVSFTTTTTYSTSTSNPYTSAASSFVVSTQLI